MRSLVRLSEDQKQNCNVCIFSRPMKGLDELSCEKKGVVAPDYYCKKFSLNILAKTARRRHSLNKESILENDYSI